MATATPNMTERRHLADRRASAKSAGRILNAMDWIAMVLLVVGGINWGLIGLFGFDLVIALFGETQFTGLIYTLVGLAALWCIYTLTKLAARE
jgi:uncharacterized membrane protein YuzA (DUF378 family)